MGRKNKNYRKDLKTQMHERLTAMLSAGEGTSKHEAEKDGTAAEKIFSYSTFHDYKKHVKYFIDYIQEHHPECTTLKAARRYVTEYLQYRVDQTDSQGNHLSASTITLDRASLNKLFGITPDDPDFFQAPKRRRQDYTRSRLPAERDKHFSEANNAEFIAFCRGTGCRRQVIEKLEGRDFYTREMMEDAVSALQAKTVLLPEDKTDLADLKDALSVFPDQEYFLHHRNDKGGRARYAPIIGPAAAQIVERMQATGANEKVWQHVPTNADIHAYRSDYATAVYRLYARPIEEIPYDLLTREAGEGISPAFIRAAGTRKARSWTRPPC